MLARSRPQAPPPPNRARPAERNEHSTLGPTSGIGVTGDEDCDVARSGGEDDAELTAERSICEEFLTALEEDEVGVLLGGEAYDVGCVAPST